MTSISASLEHFPDHGDAESLVAFEVFTKFQHVLFRVPGTEAGFDPQFIDSNVDLLVKIPPVNRHVGEWINLKLALDPAMPLPVNDDVEWQKIRVDGFNGVFKGIFEPLNLSLQLWHPSRKFIF